MNACFSIFFSVDGKRTDGHIRTLERAFADLRHALRNRDLVFQASHKCKSFSFSILVSPAGSFQAGKALALIKRPFPHRFDAVRQG